MINGRALSITSFTAARTHLSGVSKDAVYWIAVATYCLEDSTRERGIALSERTAFDVAAYAAGAVSATEVKPSLESFFGKTRAIPDPATLRQDLEKNISQSHVLVNKLVIDSMH